MDPKTVRERRDQVQILDVREDDEWSAGRIDGAVHIPLGELPARAGELDRDCPVVTVCRGGGRASKATEQLTQAGWNAQTMEGGMTQWVSDGLEFTTPDGRPGRLG